MDATNGTEKKKTNYDPFSMMGWAFSGQKKNAGQEQDDEQEEMNDD